MRDEETDWDALSFLDPAYWNHFYEEDEELDFYEWYSAEEWLPAAVEAVAARLRKSSGASTLAALDVGVGTSPLLFALAAAQPAAWSQLHGCDFAPAAIAFMEAAAAKDGHPGLRFFVDDARQLAAVPSSSVDVLCDKGCLDCFVTGDGDTRDLDAYLAAAARVLRPGGRALLLAVNGADVPHLLATGCVVADPHAGAGAGSRAAWSAAKAKAAAPGGTWEQRLWVEECVAFREKHLLVCTTTPCAAPSIRCHECGRRHSYPAFPQPGEAPPRAACSCGNKLKRFALS